MNPIPDEQIMAEVAKGNLDELKVLFERHHLHIYNFLLKTCGDKMLSEDLTQDVFYKVMKYRSSYKNGNFVSWIFTIARNSLNTYYRRNKEVSDGLEKVEHHLTANVNKDHEEKTQLQHALNQLDTSDRAVLVMNKFNGIKYDEMAEIMDSTPGALKTKVSRALQKLKTIYLENE